MSHELRGWVCGWVVVVTIAVTSAGAQDRQQPLPPLETFGPLFQVMWIGATSFSGPDVAGANLLFDVAGFYSNLASATPQTFYADLRLPAGAMLAAIQCPIFDASTTSDVTVSYFKTRYNPVTNAVAIPFSVQLSSAGSAGYQEPSLLVPPAGQLIQYEIGDDWYLYHLGVTIYGNQTRFRGCRLIWQRTVSAAPGMASFNDVPLGHPQRQFIEALAAAGITGGCGGGNYCPDAPLTRGQMAVFLSAALGLFWPF
jgi:hypothetical protein